MGEPLSTPREVSDAELTEALGIIHADQRFGDAVRAGAIAALVGLVVWGAALHAIGWNGEWTIVSWSCVLIVGAAALAVRRYGRGVDDRFANLGMALGFVIACLGEFVTLRIEGDAWVSPVAFVTSRGFGDVVLFVASAGVASEIARTKLDPELLRGMLSWRAASERDDIASRFVRNRFW